ncbi:hypothetical protein IP65_13355 [Novosphingobium sp. AAP1]|uniref:hypothetical protein n=1 Tax=Novosphingobium sp. AAP1 TaxID=1523413 RepID=UPI0006B90CC5|nr:hypothetical protein [Novosphingobium sp. AAP1]KPF53380.1 hypothetical protein IP65_13355 [Novosphingobium sp. AAP1]
MTNMSAFVRSLRRKLATLRPGDNRFNVRTHTLLAPRGRDTVPIAFRVRLVPQATRMVVSLHGAADPARRHRGVFNGFNPDLADCIQVSVSDPSLQVPGDFAIAWYAGHQGFDTPALLARAFAEMAKAWGIERTIFFGTSGGGFAALAQSHAMPGSIAVVGNPQTRIARYHAPLVSAYRAACWPALASNAALDGVIMADCTALYGAGFRNLVVYIQSLGDRHHRRAHMLPFAAAIAGLTEADRVLFHSDFHGVHGHSLPRDAYADWLRAAVISPTATPADLLDTWHALRQRPAPPTVPGGGKPAKAKPGQVDAAAQAASTRLEAWLRHQFTSADAATPTTSLPAPAKEPA